MAVFRIPINGNIFPDSSGDVFIEPYTVKATNDNWAYPVIVFNDTADKIGLDGVFHVPQNYVGSANLVIVWTSTATSGDVEFDFDYRAVGGNDTESLDQATAQESVNSNDTAPSATDERMEISISLTDGNFAAGDTVQYKLYRDGADAGDTLAAAVTVHEVFFEYTDA
jgi:hypothetical protein